MEDDTFAASLGINEARKTKLVWYVEEAFSDGSSKSDSVKKLSGVDATEEEKVYMGYLFAKYVIYKTTPQYLYDILTKICSL